MFASVLSQLNGLLINLFGALSRLRMSVAAATSHIYIFHKSIQWKELCQKAIQWKELWTAPDLLPQRRAQRI